MRQALYEPLVHELIEELHLLGRMLHDIADDVLEHILRQLHIVLEIGKCYLRLDHPELGGMARRIGILRAECRSEGIYITECHAVRLHVELTADRQIDGLSEEVPAVIHRAVLTSRHIVHIQRRDLEHLARALAVAACDDGRVHIYKAPLLKELMYGKCSQRSDSEHRLKRIGSRAQMRHGAQVLQRMALLLERIVRAGRSLYRDLTRLYLKGLLRLGGGDERSPDDESSAYVDLRYLREVVHIVMIYDLYLVEARSVADGQKAECLGVSVGTYPPADRDLRVQILLRVLIYLSYCH